MFKIKHERTADCVVAGYRPHKTGDDAIGSLLLGLYQPSGELASVGVIGAFPMAMRRELRAELEPLVTTFEGHPWNWGAHVAAAAVRCRAPAPRAAPSTAGGTWARTCRSCRCARSAWSRSATTTWRAPGSGTRRSSSAGARTARRPPARSISSKSPSATACRKSSGKNSSCIFRTDGGFDSLMASPKTVIEVAGREVRGLQPAEGLLPADRAHQAGPGPVLPGRRRRGAARRGRAADGAQAVRERRGGRAVLPEAGPVVPPGVDRDRRAAVPVRPHRRRGGAAGRRGPRLGGQPRLHRPQPAPGARVRPRPSRRAARRPRPGARRRVAADHRRRAVRAGGAFRLRPHRLGEDLGVARHAHLRAHRAALVVHRRAPGGGGGGPGDRAARTRPGHVQVVEGGAARGLRRLQPERQGPHGRVRLLGPAAARRARVDAADLGRGPWLSTRPRSRSTPCPPGSRGSATRGRA